MALTAPNTTSSTLLFCSASKSTEAVVAMLEATSSLSSLNVYKNNIGSKTAKRLAEALQVNTSLTELDVRMTRLGEDGKLALIMATCDKEGFSLLA